MKIEAKEFYRDMQKMRKIDIKKPMMQCGFIVKEDIERNSAKGLAPDGTAYPGYSDGYKRHIRKHMKGKDPNKPNLFVTGKMLASLVPRMVGKTIMILGPMGSAAYKNGLLMFERMIRWNIKNGRNPMGVSKKAEKKCDTVWKQFLKGLGA